MLRFVRLYFLLILFSALAPAARAQTCSDALAGVIADEQGGPLPGAVITVEENGLQAISDANGSFRLSGFCPGSYSLRITFIGYEPLTRSVTVPQQRALTLRLQPSETMLEDVTVEAHRASKSATQTVATLHTDELQNLHGKPLGESLKEIPGVNALQTGPSIFKPVIDGLHSQRILILNNGIRQEGQQWGVEHAPEIDPFIASEIVVLKGAETVRYGSAAMGGVIIINPPPLHETKKVGGELNLGLMSNNRMGVFSGLVEGNLAAESRWSWRLQSSVKKGGDYHTPDYNLSNTGVEEFNFSGALGFKDEGRGLEFYLSSFNSETAILRAAHTGNLDDLWRSISTERPWYIDDFSYTLDPPRQETRHHLLKVSGYQQIKGLGKLTMLYGGQYDDRQEFDIRRSGRSARPSLSLNLLSHVLDVSVDHAHATHSGSFGINGTLKVNRNDTESTGVRPLLPDFRQASAGVFVLEKWKNDNLILEGGLRYDFQHLQVLTFIQNQQLIKPRFNFSFLSGTLGATVLFSPKWRLLSNLGISSRPPHVSELYSEGLHHGTASIEEGLMRQGGNVNTEQSTINNEHSRKWINTLQYTGEKLSVDFSVYYNAINNYVYLRPMGTRFTVRGFFPVFRYEQTDAVLAGSDAAVKWAISEKFSFSSKFSYIYAKDKVKNDVVIYIPPAQWENGLSFTLPALGKLKDFRAGISVPLTFRQNRAPEAVDPRSIDEGDVPDRVFDFAPAPRGYALLNANIGFKWPVGDHMLGISLTGENILNARYRNYMNRLRYYADDIGSNFILRVSYNFLSH